MVQIGKDAPAIELQSTNDGIFNLANSTGSTVVFFYPKDDTPGCTNEAKDFSSLKAQFEDLGVTLIGISPDSLQKHEKFRTKHDLTIALAADEDKSVLMAYGVWVEKSMYGRKYMGVERSTFLIGTSGKIEEIWRKVKVKGHADTVLDRCLQLQD